MNTSMEHDNVILRTLDEALSDSVDSFTDDNALSLAQAAVEYRISDTRLHLGWCGVQFTCYRSADSKNRKPSGDDKYAPNDFRQLEAEITFYGDVRGHDTKIVVSLYAGRSFKEMLAAFYSIKAVFDEMVEPQRTKVSNSLLWFFKNKKETEET